MVLCGMRRCVLLVPEWYTPALPPPSLCHKSFYDDHFCTYSFMHLCKGLCVSCTPSFLRDSGICFLVHLFTLVGARVDVIYTAKYTAYLVSQSRNPLDLLPQLPLCSHLATSWGCCSSEALNLLAPVGHLHQILRSSSLRPSPSLLLFLNLISSSSNLSPFFSSSPSAPFCKQSQPHAFYTALSRLLNTMEEVVQVDLTTDLLSPTSADAQ